MKGFFMSKLLNDVASILAEVGVSYEEAENIGYALRNHFSNNDEIENWVDKASNANSGGECCG